MRHFQPDARRILAGCLAASALLAIAQDEVPAFKRALPADYFECYADSQCVAVQGWCATFAINKVYVDAYEKIPADPKGKAAGQCPPGWVPPKPLAVCVQRQCSIVSGRP